MPYRTWFFSLSLVLVLLLGACSPKEEAFRVSDVQTLLDAGVFDGEMAEIEESLIAPRYSLDADTLKEAACAVSASSSTSRDEVAVLVFTDKDTAAAAVDALKDHLSAQIQDAISYCPDAVPHLEKAILQQAENTILFAVGNPDTLPGAVEKLH